MQRRLWKISTLCFIGSLIFSNHALLTKAVSVSGEQSIAGISVSFDKYYQSNSNFVGSSNLFRIADHMGVGTLLDGILENQTEKEEQKEEAAGQAEEIKEEEAEEKEEVKEPSKYENIGIAVVDNWLNIREKPGEDKKIIGKLPRNAGCTIYEVDEDGWARIRSGKVAGYVLSDYLVTGEKAEELAQKVGTLTATVNTTTLKLREEASMDALTITLIPIEEELEVLKEPDDSDEWIKVELDSDKGYVYREYVDLSYELKKAVPIQEYALDGSSGVSSKRAEIVAFAKRFLGNRYVWGGTSLTNGADCSGFVMSIYRNFGYSLNRTSQAQASNGTRISPSAVKPGDLLFYGNNGSINHVAMYIGNGQVIHASNARSGIKISNMNYRSPITAVRIIND